MGKSTIKFPQSHTLLILDHFILEKCPEHGIFLCLLEIAYENLLNKQQLRNDKLNKNDQVGLLPLVLKKKYLIIRIIDH